MGPLLWAMRDGRLAPDGVQRLRSMLLGNPQARQCYIEFMFLSGSLEWDGSLREKGRAENGQPKVAEESTCPSPSIIIHDSPSLPPTLFSLQSPLGGMLFSYGVATVLMGVAILGTWLYRVSRDYQLAGPPRPAAAAVAGPEKQPELVGRITGMADCRLTGPQNAAVNLAAVPVGRKYELASGLMEISYTTGAKVLLQGPCNYEVESSSSGFLSLGKLTARVENLSAISDQLSEISKSPNLQISQICMPHAHAIVTDLGTEFGVEVTEEGDTSSHVFRG